MVDTDTFLTTLYVLVDDFGTLSLPPEHHPGPQAPLSRSEVVTLAIFGPWQGCGSERGFYRSARRHLRAAFPQLPPREHLNRQVRQHLETLGAVGRHLVHLLAAQRCLYEALDSAGVPTRAAKRRGAGWLPGLAESGWSKRLGWYDGFHRLLAVNPVGVIPGFGLSPASTKDHPLAATFFALRRPPTHGCPVWGARPGVPLSSTRALRARRTRRGGGRLTALRSSVRPSGIARPRGQRRCVAGSRGAGRASRRSTISPFIPC